MIWVSSALPWLGLLTVVLLFASVLLWPLRLDVSFRAQGEADGRWGMVGGVSLAAWSATLVWARQVDPRLEFRLLGRRLSWTPEGWRRLMRPARRRLRAASRHTWSRLDPLGLALKLLEERRHVRVRFLVVDLAYGFRDPMLTGRLVGALYMLAAVLPAPIEIRQAPRWDFEDGWEMGVDGRAIVRPWLMLLDMTLYVVRQITQRRPPQASVLAEPGTSQAR